MLGIIVPLTLQAHLGQALVEEADTGEAPQHGVFELGGLVPDRDVLVAELAPHGDDLADPRGGGVMAHDVRGHGGDVFGDQARIEPIILGEGATSAGELPKSVGIDATHRQAGVDSTEALLYHPRVPSLLMRARALATVRRPDGQKRARPLYRSS